MKRIVPHRFRNFSDSLALLVKEPCSLLDAAIALSPATGLRNGALALITLETTLIRMKVSYNNR